MYFIEIFEIVHLFYADYAIFRARCPRSIYISLPRYFLIKLYHQHNPSFCLDKHIGIAKDYRINLIGRNWLSILADMQLLAVNHFRNLFSSHPSVDFVFLLLARQNTSKLDFALTRSSVLACEAVKYGFFYFHHFSNKDSATTTF